MASITKGRVTQIAERFGSAYVAIAKAVVATAEAPREIRRKLDAAIGKWSEVCLNVARTAALESDGAQTVHDFMEYLRGLYPADSDGYKSLNVALSHWRKVTTHFGVSWERSYDAESKSWSQVATETDRARNAWATAVVAEGAKWSTLVPKQNDGGSGTTTKGGTGKAQVPDIPTEEWPEDVATAWATLVAAFDNATETVGLPGPTMAGHLAAVRQTFLRAIKADLSNPTA